MSLAPPTPQYVRQRLPQNPDDDPYWAADLALRPVFTQWPGNEDKGHVLAKATLLNVLYATRIMNIYPVVDHILGLKIDDRLRRGDALLVHDLATMRIGNKDKFLLSFASKYCAWHQPELYQIFDRNVAWMLCKYRREFRFAKVVWEELRDYPTFMSVIDAFRNHFGLQTFSRKEIDKFLWLEAVRVWEEQEAAKKARARP